MRFALSEDQAMIAETVRRMFDESFDRETLFGFVRDGVVRDEWRALIGDSGLLGICAMEAVGGLGLGAVAALAVAREAGAHAVPFPIAQGIAAAAALSSRPDDARAVIEGRTIVAIADAADRVTIDPGTGILHGELSAVAWVMQADGIIIRESRAAGAALCWLVRLDQEGVTRRARRSIDLTTPAGAVRFDGAHADPLGAPDAGHERLSIILAAAEMEGAARTCLALAVAYMKERRQFGQEIGRFQALKHIAATDALHIENMFVANAYAAWAFDASTPDADEALHIAKAYASEAARTVAEDAIQCHGGIGFTWEYGLHLYLRRILRLGAVLGTAAEHREALIAGLIAARAA